MDSLLLDVARKIDGLTTREQVLDAIADVEEVFDSLGEMDQDAAAQLIEELNRRLETLRP